MKEFPRKLVPEIVSMFYGTSAIHYFLSSCFGACITYRNITQKNTINKYKIGKMTTVSSLYLWQTTKKSPNPTAQDEKDILSKIHKHSWNHVNFDIIPCPNVLAKYYWEEILSLAIHF